VGCLLTDLGRIGIRSHEIGRGDLGEAVDALGELEALGFGALWIGADAFLARGAQLAAAGEHTVIASSVASIWAYAPEEIAEAFHHLDDARPGRFLLGAGASHAAIVERMAPGRTYARPVASMGAWLDALDAAPRPVRAEQRILAAIWPRMLGVAHDRAAGSHPYLVPATHTRAARAILGPGPLLAPAHVVVLERDPDRARALGRRHLASPYITLPNYVDNWLRHGFEPADVANGGSDRLVDALVAWGDAEAVAARIREHLDAGADHVALHVVSDGAAGVPRAAWRALAAALADVITERRAAAAIPGTDARRAEGVPERPPRQGPSP
jgi:probable F420-dependent oxidoreductase